LLIGESSKVGENFDSDGNFNFGFNYFDSWQKFSFLTKISILETFRFWTKILIFLTIISICDGDFHFERYLESKFWILEGNVQYWRKFRFFYEKIRFVSKNFLLPSFLIFNTQICRDHYLCGINYTTTSSKFSYEDHMILRYGHGNFVCGSTVNHEKL